MCQEEKPYVDLSDGRQLSAEEIEKRLLEKLQACENEVQKALWEIGSFYQDTGRSKQASAYLERLIEPTDDPEQKAFQYLTKGQTMERRGDYKSAIAFYARALPLEPMNIEVWYFINNNLGYCLNIFREYDRAEEYCRTAIRIDPERHNAYKNLGISLQGQGRLVEAANAFITAVRTNPQDPRALRFLEGLQEQHPGIREDIPDIMEQLQVCKQSVKAALEARQEMENAIRKCADSSKNQRNTTS